MTPEIAKLYFQFRTLKQPLDDGFFAVLHAFQGGNMKELLERLEARFEQVSETWVADTFRSGYLAAINDIITVVEILDEENDNNA